MNQQSKPRPKCIQCSQPADVTLGVIHYCSRHGMEFTLATDKGRRQAA